jgi:hypothetical protein
MFCFGFCARTRVDLRAYLCGDGQISEDELDSFDQFILERVGMNHTIIPMNGCLQCILQRAELVFHEEVITCHQQKLSPSFCTVAHAACIQYTHEEPPSLWLINRQDPFRRLLLCSSRIEVTQAANLALPQLSSLSAGLSNLLWTVHIYVFVS